MKVYGTTKIVGGEIGPSIQGLEVRVCHVSKQFGEMWALHDLTFDVRPGEMVALIGGSGSGKTTLLRHLTGHYRADAGRVLVANHEEASSPLVDLATLNQSGMEQLERHWAVVLQQNGLLPGSVYDNIALSLRYVSQLEEDLVRPRVRAALGAVGLDFERDASLTTDELSGGMAKRVTIARALAIDPILLFYDEPTSGLDPMLAKQIQDLVRSVHLSPTSTGLVRTSVIVTHDKDLLENLRPRIVLLDAGRIVFDGSFEAFARSGTLVARAYLGTAVVGGTEAQIP